MKEKEGDEEEGEGDDGEKGEAEEDEGEGEEGIGEYGGGGRVQIPTYTDRVVSNGFLSRGGDECNDRGEVQKAAQLLPLGRGALGHRLEAKGGEGGEGGITEGFL